MTVQYPHILKFDSASGATTEIDENGDTVIIPGVITTVEVQCRFEPNSKGQFLISNDGLQLYYAWMVYMPLGEVKLQSGMVITGFQNQEVIAFGTVQRFSEGQLNSTAWL